MNNLLIARDVLVLAVAIFFAALTLASAIDYTVDYWQTRRIGR